jgi:hypothetical protein
MQWLFAYVAQLPNLHKTLLPREAEDVVEGESL